jgi:hypothetical protein
MHDLRDTKGAALFGALIWNLTSFAESDDFPDDVSEFCSNLAVSVKAQKIARQTCDPHH